MAVPVGSPSKIVVMLATYNGSSTLDATLKGYSTQLPITAEWQLVVINNGSNDDTAGILHGWQSRLPITVIDAPSPGKNHALNSALSILGIQADLYIFTDDDAIPEPDFLRSWERAITLYPDAMLFGGEVMAHFVEEPPQWLSKFEKHYPEIYAHNRFESGVSSADRIFGPNMAVRGEILTQGFRFDENIGPNSADSHYPMGSETEFCTRVEREIGAGTVYMVNDARVHHQVRHHQMTREFVASRAFRHGRGFAMRRDLEGKSSLGWLAAVLQCFFNMAASTGNAGGLWQSNWLKGYRQYFKAKG